MLEHRPCEEGMRSWACLAWRRDSCEGLDSSRPLPGGMLSRREGGAFDSGPGWEDETTYVC